VPQVIGEPRPITKKENEEESSKDVPMREGNLALASPASGESLDSMQSKVHDLAKKVEKNHDLFGSYVKGNFDQELRDLGFRLRIELIPWMRPPYIGWQVQIRLHPNGNLDKLHMQMLFSTLEELYGGLTFARLDSVMRIFFAQFFNRFERIFSAEFGSNYDATAIDALLLKHGVLDAKKLMEK